MKRQLMALTVLLLFAGAPLRAGGAEPPDRAPAAKEPGVAPTVLISSTKGFLVKPCLTKFCQGGWRIVAKTKAGRYDYSGLRKVLLGLRPKYKHLPALHLNPANLVRWRVVVKAMDTARRTAGNKPLFPVILIGLSGRMGGEGAP